MSDPTISGDRRIADNPSLFSLRYRRDFCTPRDIALRNGDYEIVWSADDATPGDLVAYTGAKTREPLDRDWLIVTVVENGFIRGYRLEPQDWEAEIEFAIYPRQIEAHGVWLILDEAIPVKPPSDAVYALMDPEFTAADFDAALDKGARRTS